jgi:hypothetical protein
VGLNFLQGAAPMATAAQPRQADKRTSSTKALSPKAKTIKSGDEIWDDLLATPESEAFLTLMVAEVRQEEADGKLIEGGWDEV